MQKSIFRLLLVILLCSPLTLNAQREEKWCGEYTYHGSLSETPEYAKIKAFERLQIQALIETFGSSVTQTNLTNISNVNGVTNVDFASIGGSDVNGEWIETIGEPEYQVYIDGEFQVVTVKACGRIRKITSAPIDFKAKLLRNGVDDKFEDENFKEGDNIFLSFSSPEDGYLTVYLLDDSGEAYCMLPYDGMPESSFKVKANRRYVLFSQDFAYGMSPSIIDELYLTCDNDIEHNQVYIIFSPNKFAKAMDRAGGKDKVTNHILPRHLHNREFHSWLVKCRKRDKEMRVDKRIITIKRS